MQPPVPAVRRSVRGYGAGTEVHGSNRARLAQVRFHRSTEQIDRQIPGLSLDDHARDTVSQSFAFTFSSAVLESSCTWPQQSSASTLPKGNSPLSRTARAAVGAKDLVYQTRGLCRPAHDQRGPQTRSTFSRVHFLTRKEIWEVDEVGRKRKLWIKMMQLYERHLQ